MSTASVFVPMCSVDETGEVAAWLDTISFCNDFCDWVDNEWSIASLAAEPDTQQPGESPAASAADTASAQPPPEESVETRPAEVHTRGSRRSRIGVFFKRLWKAVKLPSLFCRGGESPTPQLNPHQSDPEEVPVPGCSGLQQMPNADPAVPELSSVPGHSGLQQMPDADLAVPELPSVPGPSGLHQMPGGNPAVHKPSSVPGFCDCKPNEGSLDTFYEVKDMLGSGWYGKVFKGIRKSDGQEVAIKRICKWKAGRHLLIRDCPTPLVKEVAMMQMLRRPSVCPYVIEMYEWFDQPKVISLILEYPQPCKVLREFIADHQKLSEPIARHLMRQLVLAVQHCTDHGVFHNDIHTKNILVNTSSLELKLIDFGCALLVDSAQNLGAMEYRPPEVFILPKHYAILGNVWALGIVLYMMVTGHFSFFSVLQWKACPRWDPKLSIACRDLISQCLSFSRAKQLTFEQILQHEWFSNQC